MLARALKSLRKITRKSIALFRRLSLLLFLKSLLVDRGSDRAATLQQANRETKESEDPIHKMSGNLSRNEEESTRILIDCSSGRRLRHLILFSSTATIWRSLFAVFSRTSVLRTMPELCSERLRNS